MKVSAFERHVVHRDAGSESVSERLGLEVRAACGIDVSLKMISIDPINPADDPHPDPEE